MVRIFQMARLGDPVPRRVGEPVRESDQSIRNLIDDLIAASRGIITEREFLRQMAG